MKSYAEEFYRQYEQPHIGKLIVGFSGIDPSRKMGVQIDDLLMRLEELEGQASGQNDTASDESVDEMLDEVFTSKSVQNDVDTDDNI